MSADVDTGLAWPKLVNTWHTSIKAPSYRLGKRRPFGASASGPAEAAQEQPDAGPTPAAEVDPHTVKTPEPTDIKYNICTFDSGANVGAGASVTPVMAGKRYERKMHNILPRAEWTA